MADNGEFQEIGHAGGKLEIIYEPATAKEGAGIGTKYSHSAPTPCSMIQMAASLDGKVLEFVPIRGMRTVPPPEPSPIVSTFVISDREGMFGRRCPKCTGYFRTDQPATRSICPYCSREAPAGQFTTPNQRTFIDRICKAYVEAWTGKKTVVLELDKLADALPENRPAWGYNEERQQNTYVCTHRKCRARFDVLGEYAGCPACGRRNSLQVVEGHFVDLSEEIAKAGGDKNAIVEWEKMTHAFSDFEAMANDIKARLALLPATPKRRRDIENLSFQRLAQARENILAWHAIDIFAGLNEADLKFLSKMLQRRHVFVHNGGRVDEDYLAKTGDTSVRLHQQLDVRRGEMDQLLPALRKCAANLFEGYEAITA